MYWVCIPASYALLLHWFLQSVSTACNSLLLNTIILEHLPAPSPNLMFYFQLLTLFTLVLLCISHVFTMLPSHSIIFVHIIAYFHVIYVQLPSTTTLSPLGTLYHTVQLSVCRNHQPCDCLCHLCHLWGIHLCMHHPRYCNLYSLITHLHLLTHYT